MKINVGFVAGLLSGAILIASVWAGSVWWKSRSEDGWVWVSGKDKFGGVAIDGKNDAATYDACLVAGGGNTVVCDAFMRMMDRLRTREAANKEQAAKLLAAGFSKREVFNWAMQNDLGFKGSLEAAGISEKDYRDNNY